jgi:hypothetical protein
MISAQRHNDPCWRCVVWWFLCALTFFRTPYPGQADLKVFVTPYESQADVKVFFVPFVSQAKGDGLWFEDRYPKNHLKLHFVAHRSQADLIICVVAFQSQSGWTEQGKKKMGLLIKP